jgi:hypothetical protein
MTFRYARHTTNLKRIEEFYCKYVGLEKLGGFENHNEYDGLFLGNKTSNWHLEFTMSNEAPMSTFDPDDILVFYVTSKVELSRIKELLIKGKIPLETPKNPYWSKYGIMIDDPDGYKIVFSVKTHELCSKDSLTHLVTHKGYDNWNALIEYVKKIPYGRNSNRFDFSLVVKENKGTCSSKHAFLKSIAELNGVQDVKLIIGIYKMNYLNTPKIGSAIKDKGLDYIPEAHCYLKINNRRIDVTSCSINIGNLESSILEEIEIEPSQVVDFKGDYHKHYIKEWRIRENIDMSFNAIWNLREQCITNLSN